MSILRDWSAVSIHLETYIIDSLFWAVVFLVSLAVVTSQICLDLRSNTNAITDFNSCDGAAYFHSTTDDFVANAQWKRRLAPAASNTYAKRSVGERLTKIEQESSTVDIGAANTAGINSDIDVSVLKLLELELFLMEGLPS